MDVQYLKINIMAKGQESKKPSGLEATLADLNNKFGRGAVIRMDEKPLEDIKVIPSGGLGLDIALGVGGYPRGRIIELMGWESSGKTTLALHAIAQAQLGGGKAALVDAEHAFDPTYGEALGIDLSKLYLSQPSSGEEGLEIAEKLAATGEFDVIVVDSVAALVPQAEINGEMGDSNMGVHARLMSQAMRKMSPIVSKSNTCMIFINQLREKIGVMFGNPETTTGGNALKFYASVRINVSRQSKPGVDSEGVASHSKTKIRIIKNKVAPPFKTAEFDIIYGKGINKTGEIVDLASELGIMSKSGSWYSYDGNKIGQGREATIDIMNDNQEMLEEITSILMQGNSK